ncbi:MAG: transposase [Anaerolineae bacterium]|nr:transposase [Anaerolineae bacterium]
MNCTYEYRLYPRQRERSALEQMLEQMREVYNLALQECQVVCETTDKHAGGLAQWGYFREWRKQAGILLNASSLQHTLRRLDKAYAAFFRRLKAKQTAGHPHFKPGSRFNSLEYTYGDGCSVRYDEDKDRVVLYLQNVGELKMKLHRSLPAGIDMGLLRLPTLSEGTRIDNPRWLRASLAKLRVAQRRLVRRTKGSQRRAKARRRVALLHERVANTRRDFWHKTTHWLTKHYRLIAHEDLTLGFMTHHPHLSLSAHDAGLGLFQQLLEYKAGNAGTTILLVNPAHTSQACSGCGALVTKALSVRVHDCPHCSLKLDRDENAALNILSSVQVGEDFAVRR